MFKHINPEILNRAYLIQIEWNAFRQDESKGREDSFTYLLSKSLLLNLWFYVLNTQINSKCL